MQDIMGKVKERFSKVDCKPYIQCIPMILPQASPLWLLRQIDKNTWNCYSLGKDRCVINGCFELFDKAVDCKALSEQLERTLSVSWDIMYEYGKHYEQYGNLKASMFFDNEGIDLGRWLVMIRSWRKIWFRSGILSPERITAIEKIAWSGMPTKIKWMKMASGLEFCFQASKRTVETSEEEECWAKNKSSI